MIQIQYNRENMVLLILGHAGYAERGRDIVCAAVTALAGTLERCIQERGERSCTWDSGETVFHAEGTENLRPCFETVVTGLKMLAEEFPEYIEFKETSSTACGGPPSS